MVKDDGIHNIDPQAMQVVFPNHVHPSLMDEITYPKNPAHRRYRDQFVRDCFGKKLAMYRPISVDSFGNLLTIVSLRLSIVIQLAPTWQSIIPESSQKFRRSNFGGRDRRGGGVVLDCDYELTLVNTSQRDHVLEKIRVFLRVHNGIGNVE